MRSLLIVKALYTPSIDLKQPSLKDSPTRSVQDLFTLSNHILHAPIHAPKTQNDLQAEGESKNDNGSVSDIKLVALILAVLVTSLIIYKVYYGNRSQSQMGVTETRARLSSWKGVAMKHDAYRYHTGINQDLPSFFFFFFTRYTPQPAVIPSEKIRDISIFCGTTYFYFLLQTTVHLFFIIQKHSRKHTYY